MANFPVPFRGTKEQRDANFATHYWGTFGDDCPVCMECDAKVWHQAAYYPCGTEPERIDCDYDGWVALLRSALDTVELTAGRRQELSRQVAKLPQV